MKSIKLLLVSMFLAGCVTAKEDSLPIDQTRAYRLAKLVGYSGVVAVLATHPEQRPQLDRARAGIYTLVSQQRWDVAAVATALVQAGVTQAQTPEANLVVAGATLLTDVWLHKPVDLSQHRTAEAYVRGVDAGVRLAMDQPAVRSRGFVDPVGQRLLREAEATRPRNAAVAAKGEGRRAKGE